MIERQIYRSKKAKMISFYRFWGVITGRKVISAITFIVFWFYHQGELWPENDSARRRSQGCWICSRITLAVLVQLSLVLLSISWLETMSSFSLPLVPTRARYQGEKIVYYDYKTSLDQGQVWSIIVDGHTVSAYVSCSFLHFFSPIVTTICTNRRIIAVKSQVSKWCKVIPMRK